MQSKPRLSLPVAILDNILQYNNQQCIIDDLISLNNTLLAGSTFLTLVEQNELDLVQTAVQHHPELSQTRKEALDVALVAQHKEMIILLLNHRFDKPKHPIICDIARTEDSEFQVSMFSDKRLDINKLYVGDSCTVAVHEFDALTLKAFEIIINRPSYMHHNHVCPQAEVFLVFSLDIHHELHGYDSIDKAKRLIGHPKCDIYIKHEGKALIEIAMSSGLNNVVTQLHDKMVMHAYALC